MCSICCSRKTVLDEGKNIEHKMPFRDVHVARWICFFLFGEPETYAIRRGSSLRATWDTAVERETTSVPARRRGIPTRMKEITVRDTFANYDRGNSKRHPTTVVIRTHYITYNICIYIILRISGGRLRDVIIIFKNSSCCRSLCNPRI